MRKVVLFLVCGLMGVVAMGQTAGPVLLRQPAVSQTQIAFVYAGDLWVVGREGGEARRLTAGAGTASNPAFSPDGSLLAYSARVDGNTDVYVMAASGGVAQRLTYHPGGDLVQGWTPDGKVLFLSARNSYRGMPQLFAMGLTKGGFPFELPLPVAFSGAYSPDGKRIAYAPTQHFQAAWKGYRGGMTGRIWLASLPELNLERIPRENSNDTNPMWVGDKVYFLSDRNGPVTLFAYDTRRQEVKQAVENKGLDIKTASAGPGAIVYEQFGEIYLFDLNSGNTHRVTIHVAGDVPALRAHYDKVNPKQLQNFGISPSGARAVFEAHGEIFTVPAEKGDIRNLTNSPGVADRDPAWSPDGKWVAYFSDGSGEYQLELRKPDGMGEAKKIALGTPPSFYYTPTWSPDSKKVAYTDKRGYLWYVETEKEKAAPKRVDTDRFADQGLQPAWSPDSKWLAYVKNAGNFRKVLYLYSLEQDKAYPVTDGMSDAKLPVFDVNGKYLYFTASTDMGLALDLGDLSALGHPVTRSAYVVVLDKALPSPLPPENDEEKTAEEKPKAEESTVKDEKTAAKEAKGAKEEAKDKDAKDKEKEKKPVVVKVDVENIGQRVLALPIPARNYLGLWRGKEGILFLAEGPGLMPLGGDGPPPATIQKFDLAKRKVEKVVDGASRFAVSANGEKMLFQQGESWTIAEVGKEVKPGEGALKMGSLRVYVEPKAEWKQMYRETWRIQRDFFYDPGFHGLDLAAAEKQYAPWVDNLSGRSDLTYLMQEMLGNLRVGHMYVWGPRSEDQEVVKGGLLGADYKVENDRYRFARVYNGENWNPELRAPLTQPGVNVAAGEYLLAVNGRELHAADNLFSLFQATAGKAITIRVGPNPEGKGAREVVVVPVEDEGSLRNLAWIEGNRRLVEKLSGGRVGYVWLPDTAAGGFSSFNRYYFAQIGKEGAVIDERFNHGGQLADYFVDYLRRPVLSCATQREGEDTCNPTSAIYGPKVMLINEFAGSGGDALPWYFRKLGIGPLVGRRTWGGLVGIGGYPDLIDGGGVTSPRWAIYGLEGDWEVENHGIAPDYEVEMDPKAWSEGHDLQLERGVKLVLEQLEKKPTPKYKRPEYKNMYKAAGGSSK